jgi:NAD dependent epimerase/dehydratase
MYNSFDHWGWLDSAAGDIKKQLEIYPADIRDPHRVAGATEGVTTVYHLAALVAVPYSYHSPESYVETNVRGTLNLLQAARQAGVAHFVHTSTSETYGTARRVPIDETHPLVGQSPYAASKIAADQMAIAFHCSYGLPVTILRPFNTYGPRQSARAVIPTIIAQLAAGRETVHLGALRPSRDFTYVEDIVEGFLAASDRKDLIGETINLGSGREMTIGNLAELIAQLMNRPLKLTADKARLRPDDSEVMRLVCDAGEAARLLEWKPRLTLEDGLARTIDWFSDRSNLAGYRTDRYVI